MISDYRLVSIKEIQQKSLLKKFDCGIEQLNEFLSRYAIKNEELGIGRTFVALNANNRILGYFTLATAQVAYQEIPDEYRDKLPKYPIPALRIARLAVDKELQGKGIGGWLLSQVFIKVIQVADITGLYLIIVDAKETSKNFYEHYGFQKFMDEDLSYFMVIDTIRKAILPVFS
ncbi:GNAT family N-acetyltransferase [Treponema sp. OMZ 792]|uniref:GNAT family N-acetyltransferase n=1 Tax=unclassified Treponema TaxID=2638727 RepID=UPI0020A2519B|nr:MULTISPECIES: GNAT family N-acetyltransferase [unclassified Treponema]UTC74924.1 GNAT family N-acetyltransferase [Treponema sp. OMZ 792]UTC76720.1 GNAT family N-acetyltransferase [Treponema sp. OMZ 799]UTC81318.1 GNAT family N-acetyltransferase [Treponema sp. OMZ 798]